MVGQYFHFWVKGYTINGTTWSCPSAQVQHHVGMGIWVTSIPSAVILARCFNSCDTGKRTENIWYIWLFYIRVVVGNRKQIFIHATYVTAYGKNEILFRPNNFCMFLTFVALAEHSPLNSCVFLAMYVIHITHRFIHVFRCNFVWSVCTKICQD